MLYIIWCTLLCTQDLRPTAFNNCNSFAKNEVCRIATIFTFHINFFIFFILDQRI